MAQVATTAKAVPGLTASSPVANTPCIKYAKPLYYLSLLTATTCPIDFDRYTARSGICHKLYCLLMLTVILVATAYSFLGRKDTLYLTLMPTVKITDLINLVAILISNIYAIGNILFFGERYVKTYFQLLQQIDRHLQTTMNLRRKRFRFYTYLSVTHLMLLVLGIYDGWTWTATLTFDIWIFYSFRLYAVYLNILVVIQVCTFASALKLRFKILNERLFFISMNWVGHLDSTKAIVLRDLFRSYKKNVSMVQPDGLHLKCLIRMHDLLCDLIGLVNEAFGTNVVLLVCNIIINTVAAFNLTLVFGGGGQTSTMDMGHIIATNIFWALLFISLGVVLSRTCDSASQEAWNSATISYKLLACIPTNSHVLKERDFRIELKQLAMQVEHRRPAFNASGFFAINNSMLYVILGAISSYIVIIIQFNNSPLLLGEQNSTVTLM